MSKGQSILKEWLVSYFPSEPFYENHRPDWLEGLEVDFFFPNMRCGWEFQGAQHFTEVFANHSVSLQQVHDRKKLNIFHRLRGKLFVVDAWELTHGIMSRIRCAAKFSRQSAGHPVPDLEQAPERFQQLNQMSWDYFRSLRRIDPLTTRPAIDRAKIIRSKDGIHKLSDHYDEYLKTHPSGDYEGYIKWRRTIMA